MSENPTLFNLDNDDLQSGWKKEWQDMPEFKHDNLYPFKTIKVHFANIEDIKKFSELLNQVITTDTKSIWFPKLKINEYKNKWYSDES